MDITEHFNRQGVMIFSSSVKHAEEILSYLPSNDARLIIGDTQMSDRNQAIDDFKQKKFKYLVNVSVPHYWFRCSPRGRDRNSSPNRIK